MACCGAAPKRVKPGAAAASSLTSASAACRPPLIGPPTASVKRRARRRPRSQLTLTAHPSRLLRLSSMCGSAVLLLACGRPAARPSPSPSQNDEHTLTHPSTSLGREAGMLCIIPSMPCLICQSAKSERLSGGEGIRFNTSSRGSRRP
ncbi:hypothetical protein BU23DRAFT_327462 [Bimuria novae-zelandiae CBS 107.79]|uniref:Uncharacterized protein n=1 Tax=Bimuria novae-zelandiae CBS 107.79 TaxID=1447943 RepID=A0A6A5URA7_9PLEO|nr:hypothetical protein BU23DRAFT_327462 [Bimuria novae-zelandiae CBS 107.79]